MLLTIIETQTDLDMEVDLTGVEDQGTPGGDSNQPEGQPKPKHLNMQIINKGRC